MYKKIIFYVFLLSLCFFTTHGQTIQGIVKSLSGNTVLEGAQCHISHDNLSVIVTTNKNGFFLVEDSLRLNNMDSITVKISKPGYESRQVSKAITRDSIQDFGIIFLEHLTTLDEITVEAKVMTVKDGNFLYTPPKSIIESSSFAVDVIGRLGIPGIVYNPIDRSISEYKGNILILVNDIPSSLEEIKNIRAGEVIRVDYSQNVPLMYANSYTSVVNVKIKKHDTGGSWNVYDTNDFTGNSVDVSSSFFFYKGPSKWNVRYNFGYRNNTKTYDSMTSSYIAPQLNVETHTESKSPFNYRSHSGQVQYVYAPSSSMIIMTSYALNGYNTLRKSYMDIDDTMNGYYSGNGRTHWNRWNQNINLYLSKGFGENNSLDINIDGNLNTHDYSSYLLYELLSGKTKYVNDLNSKRYALNGIGQYTHLFKDMSKLSFSYQFTFSNTRNRYYETDNNFKMKEANQYIYLQYQRNIIPRLWAMVRTGLKIDNLKENKRSEVHYNNNSSIALQYNISDRFTLSYNGSFSTQSLSLNLIQDNPVQVNPYLINNGNPNLKPYNKLINNVCLYFSGNNYSFAASGANVWLFNPIYTAPIYDTNLNAYVNIPENCKYDNHTNISLSGNVWNIFKMFQIQGNFSYSHVKFENSEGWKNHRNAIGGDLYIAWYKKKFIVNYAMSLPVFGLDGYNLNYWNENPNYYMIGAVYKPMDNLEIGLQWWWMFDKKGWAWRTKIQSPQYLYTSERQIRNDSNWVRFTCSYTFNFGSRPKTQDRQRILNVRDSQTTFGDYTIK